MPYLDRNDECVLKLLREHANETKKWLRQLRHEIETAGTNVVPIRLMTELGYHASLLADLIRMTCVRTEVSGVEEYNSFQNPLEFVDYCIGFVPIETIRPDRDRAMYVDELGFTPKEFKDLVVFRNGLFKDPHGSSIESAFDYFSDSILRDLRRGKSEVKPLDWLLPISGVLGIAADVWGFFLVPAPEQIVGSTTTGVAAIASKFGVLKEKLFSRRSP